MKPWQLATDSVASRLVALFTLGSAVIMLAVGYTLFHALAMQVEARDLAEINGKTKVVRHILAGIGSPQQFDRQLGKLGEITVGHPHLSIGVYRDGRWQIALAGGIANRLRGLPEPVPERIERIALGEHQWWLRRIEHHWPEPTASKVDVYIAVEVSASQRLLQQHRVVAILVGLLGTVLSGLLAYWVTRRSLLPLGLLARQAEQLTAEQLGAPLDVAQAPAEVRGLVESLNGMLSRLHESFRSLEQFSADIAHELRTPLNNLMLQTQVTLSRPRDAESYVEALHSNLEELERLQRMVSDMLFLARADRGLLSLQRLSVDLRQEADSVAEYFELAASEKGQSILISGQLQVLGDRLMLRRVLTNLLSNAVRYAPDQATIRLQLQHDARELTISNSAGPLQQTELSQLFARFSRGQAAHQRDTDGMGLGLAIVDSIVRLHDGKVSVRLDGETIVFCVRFAV